MEKIISILLLLLVFVLGVFVVKIVPKVEKFFRVHSYNNKYASERYKKWDKNTIYLESGETLTEYESNHDEFIIFFWATWCPHCKKILDTMQQLSKKNNCIGLPYDKDFDYYSCFIQTKNFPFANLVTDLSSDGSFKFIQREGIFYVPLIPSCWVIKNGEVQEIFVAEVGIEEIKEHLLIP